MKTFKVDKSLEIRVRINRLQFIRNAILIALGSACPYIMKLLRYKTSKVQRKGIVFLIISFLCLMANIAIPSLHAHSHELKEGSSLQDFACVHTYKHDAHAHHDDHVSDESQDDPVSDHDSSDCHLCFIFSSFSAQIPVLSFESNLCQAQETIFLTSQQDAFLSVLALKEYSHAPPSNNI